MRVIIRVKLQTNGNGKKLDRADRQSNVSRKSKASLQKFDCARLSGLTGANS